MTVELQILSFLGSLVFGFIFSILSKIHFFFIKKLNIFWWYIYTFLFMSVISLSYIYLLYIINGGILHFYFLVLVIIGFIMERVLSNNVKFKRIRQRQVDKFFNK